MVAFQYRMPAGIPGEITRSNFAIVEPNLMAASGYPTAYGVFVKLVSGAIEAVVGSGDAVYGLIARPYPTNAAGPSVSFGGGAPSLTDPCSILRGGYMTVKLARGTAVKGGGVYVRTTADSYALGDIEDSTNSGSGTTAVTGCTFMGAADASGNVEIAFNI